MSFRKLRATGSARKMAPTVRVQNLSTAMVVVAIVLACQTNVTMAKKLDGNRLLAPDHLVDIRITLPAADWKELREQARNPGAFFSGASVENPYKYFKADLWIDGTKIESIGVRKKGLFGSLDSQRPSLKIKFDEFVKQDPVKGLSRLTLNNNKQDGSQVSQLLTYKLFGEAGIHAPRSNFAKVTVNDEYLGIYSNVESIKKPFLARSFGDKSGNLYEGTITDFHPKTIEKLEVKTNEDQNDRSDVARLAKLLAAEGELKLDELEQIVDVENFLHYWAIESIIRFWDGYASNQNNYFFYVNPKNGRGYFIPWGADWAFTRGGPFGFANQGTTAVYAQSILANRLYHTKGMPDRYRRTLQHLLDEVWNEEKLVAEIDRIERMISPHLHETQQGAPGAMDQMRRFINTRREELQKDLSTRPARVPAEPRKPMYTVTVGKASGSFRTVWSERPPADPTKTGKLDFRIDLDGKRVDFEQLGASAQTFQFPRFRPGGGGRPPGDFRPPVNLLFAGNRAEDGKRLTISLFVDREEFEKQKSKPIAVTGMLTEGTGGGFGFGFGGGVNRSVNGQLHLKEGGTNPDDAVVGEVDLNIVEVHGGFFGRRPPPRGPGARRPSAGRRPRPDAQRPSPNDTEREE